MGNAEFWPRNHPWTTWEIVAKSGVRDHVMDTFNQEKFRLNPLRSLFPTWAKIEYSHHSHLISVLYRYGVNFALLVGRNLCIKSARLVF